MKLNISLWDWYVQVWEAASRLVLLSMPNTDICVLNYSVVGDKKKLPELKEFWMENMNEIAPECKVFVLHAMQIDRREDDANAMTRQEGLALAKELGGLPYFESSSRTGQGVDEMIGGAVIEWLKLKRGVGSGPKTRAKESKCVMQ